MTRKNTNPFMKKSEKFWMVFEEQITEKRRENNPYIDKVFQSKNILTKEEFIFEQAGNWQNYFWNKNEIVLEIWKKLYLTGNKIQKTFCNRTKNSGKLMKKFCFA